MLYKFWKVSGAGNDFIVFDNRKGDIPELKKPDMARRLCRRGFSIGADGVLFIEPSEKHHFTMRIFNADGSEGETCGNASRCVALLALKLGFAPQDMAFDTQAGSYRAHVDGSHARVSLTDPHAMRLDIEAAEDWIPADEIHAINTGVPHCIVFMEDLEQADVELVGRRLRHDARFQPEGTNVDFAKVMDKHNMRVRTYERGVEAETLACGTGCVASAVIAGALGMVRSPVSVHTRGGMTNVIHFRFEDGVFTDILLEGEARIVFTGGIDLEL